MDAVDLLVVLLRRWYVILPVVLLSGSAAYVAGDRLQPEHEARSSLVVLTPSELPPEGTKVINPYRVAGADNTISAVSLVAEGSQSRGVAVSLGLSPVYEVDSRDRIVEISASSSDAEQAVDTVAYVQELMINDLQDRQDRVQAPRLDQYFFEVLSAPSLTRSEVPGLQRTRFGIFGAGVVLAGALALMTDRIASRASRRGRPEIEELDGGGHVPNDAQAGPVGRGSDQNATSGERRRRHPPAEHRNTNDWDAVTPSELMSGSTRGSV